MLHSAAALYVGGGAFVNSESINLLGASGSVAMTTSGPAGG